MLIAKIKSICFKRAGVLEEHRKKTFFFCDEFHNFVTKSLSEILEELRKYKLFMGLASQFVGQGMTSEAVRSQLGNTKLLIGAESDPHTNAVLGEAMGMDKITYTKLPEHHFHIFDRTRVKKKKYKYELKPRLFSLPKSLAHMKSPLYLSDGQLKDLFSWLAFSS